MSNRKHFLKSAKERLGRFFEPIFLLALATAGTIFLTLLFLSVMSFRSALVAGFVLGPIALFAGAVLQVLFRLDATSAIWYAAGIIYGSAFLQHLGEKIDLDIPFVVYVLVAALICCIVHLRRKPMGQSYKED